MKIRCFYLIFRIVVRENDTHDASHLIIFNRFRKDVKNVYLKISENSL